MTDANTPDPAALVASLPPDLYQKLVKVASEAERHKILDNQLTALTFESRERMTRNRVAFRDLHNAKFDAFDWRAALVGAPGQEYQYRVLSMSFFLRPPIASVTRAVQAMTASDPAKDLQPITTAEFRLLCWIARLQQGDKTPTALSAQGAPLEQLKALRTLPDIVLEKVASEVENLETWLNVQLELDGGKS